MVVFFKYAERGLSVFLGYFGAKILLGFPEMPNEISKQLKEEISGLDFGAALHFSWQGIVSIANWAA